MACDMSRSRVPDQPATVWSIQTEFTKALELHKRGQLAAAEQICHAILKSHRRHFDAGHLLAVILLQRDEAEAAEKQFCRALKLAPRDTANGNLAEAHNNRGIALARLDRFDEAIASFERAFALQPDYIGVLINQVSALHKLGRFDEALALSDKAIAMQPQLADFHYGRGRALDRLRRFDEAIASFDRAITLKPDFHDAYYGRSFCRLMRGSFAEGWEDNEHRWHSQSYRGEFNPAYAAPSVTRDSLKNKSILIVAEQGAGDEIMFASMIPDLVQDAQSVALECDARLSALFGRSFPGVKLIARKKPSTWKASDFDYVIPALSLGRFYRNTPNDFPHRTSYLKPSVEIAANWKARLSDLGNDMKVGISWKGGTESTRRQSRSIPLDLWMTLLASKGVRFVSLQYGQVREEIERTNQSLPYPIACFEPSEIDDFDQLAGLASALDVIVTVDNTLVHLSGAIGKSCQALIPYDPEWRYGSSGRRMPWYSSVELHRQERPGEWAKIVNRIAAELKGLNRSIEEN